MGDRSLPSTEKFKYTLLNMGGYSLKLL